MTMDDATGKSEPERVRWGTAYHNPLLGGHSTWVNLVSFLLIMLVVLLLELKPDRELVPHSWVVSVLLICAIVCTIDIIATAFVVRRNRRRRKLDH